jgi:malonate transporter
MSAVVFVKLLAIFAVVAIGWGAARSGKLGADEASRVLSAAAFYVFVPALLFRTTARIDFQRLDVRVVVAFFVPTLVLVVVVYTALRSRARAGAAAAEPSVRAITVAFGNAVQIGIPLAAALFGEAGLALHLTVVGLHSLTLLTVLTALVELDLARAEPPAGGRGTRLLRTLATTVRNTVIHPVVLPALADEIRATLGQAVVPVCLVLIGVSLAHYGVRGALRAATLLAAIKLAVHPLAVLAFARLVVGLTGVPLAIVVLLAALPVGSNALIFAQRYATLPGETSTAIVVSTLAFVVTAPLWLAILHVTG